jgi:NOL1/NOP2/sun family putative RNA methylase
MNNLLSRYHKIIDDPQAFDLAAARPLDRFLWVNELRCDVDALRRMLIRSGFEVRRLPWHDQALRLSGAAEGLGRHWAYRAGLFQVQEASSMIPVLVLNPRPGERILDLCAAPGNKTAQMAMALKNRGTVVSNDIVGQRQRATRMVLDRLGLLNVTLTCLDGVNYPRTAGVFDAVLVDAPCTCEGTSRRNPERCRSDDPPYRRKASKQKLLLRQAIRRCAQGGRIVYSTCTYAPEENEAVIDAVMKEWPGAVRLRPTRLPHFRTAPGLTRWQGARFHPDLVHSMRIWPHHNDTGGFFVALMEKRAADSPHSARTPHLGQDAQSAFFDDGGRRLAADDPILVEIQRRFGLPVDALAELVVTRRNRREIWATTADHRPPAIRKPSMGLSFIRVGNRYPKLTTAAAMLIGRSAVRNRLDLLPDQLKAYLARRHFPLKSDQVDSISGGYVLVHYQGHPLGLGCWHADPGMVESLYPKNMAVDADHLIL